jgi:phosphoserine phosphatase RsbU/P
MAVRRDPATASHGGFEDEHRLRIESETITELLRQSLLPARLPEIPRAEIAARLESASRVNVSGDFYDCFAVEEDRWLLVIADVTGKGPGAAATASMVRYAVRTAASEGQNPPQIAATANRVVYLGRADTADRFATLAVAEISAVGEEFNLQTTVAGHPPVLLASGGEIARWLAAPGPLLGLNPDQRFKSRSSRLGAGDVALLYTDGLSEARIAGGRLGEEAVSAALIDHSAESAEAIASALAGLPAGGQITDDLTILVLKVN